MLHSWIRVSENGSYVKLKRENVTRPRGGGAKSHSTAGTQDKKRKSTTRAVEGRTELRKGRCKHLRGKKYGATLKK